MFFGEGNNSKAKCIDVAAHEFTHGVVEYSNAKLEYVNQSGALNEAFADIFGEMVELFVKGTNDWLIGFDSGKVARSMSDPGSIKISNTSYVYPAKMSEFWTAEDPRLEGFEDRDNGGVHFNSSIVNKSYYNLAKVVSSKVVSGCFVLECFVEISTFPA
jgi:Zn-dependent metalloprotease